MVLIITENPLKSKRIFELTGIETLSTNGHVKKVCGLKDGNDLVYNETCLTLPKLNDDILIATDLTEEGEIIAKHICEMLNIINPVRLRLFSMTEFEIMNAKPYEIDTSLIDSFESKKRDDIITGSILSAYLYKTVSSTYEKKWY